VGVDPAIRDALFLHDVKTSRRGTAGENGAGLGLPFCHDIMLAHGGGIDVDSPEGKGARFTLRIGA
jgi:signal transduction histidine kinase